MKSSKKNAIILSLLISFTLTFQARKYIPTPNPNLKFSAQFSSFPGSHSESTQVSKFLLYGVKKEQSDQFIIDLTSDKILNGNGEENWGIDCEDDPNCQIINKEYEEVKYMSSKIKCQLAESLVRFSKNQIIDISDQGKAEAYNKLSFNICKFKGNDWKFGKVGLFGLNPQSQIWRYLQNSYKFEENFNFLDLSFEYNFKNLTASENGNSDPLVIGKKKIISGYIVVNSLQQENNEIVEKEFNPQGSDIWVFKDIFYRYSGNSQNFKTDICMDNKVNWFFAFDDAINLKKKISENFCRKISETGIGCKKSDLKTENEIKEKGKFTLEFYEGEKAKFNTEFFYDELYYFDNEEPEEMKFYFDDFFKIPSDCRGKNLHLILGKLGMSKVKFFVKVSKDLTKIGFAKLGAKVEPTSRKINHIRLIVIGTFGFCLFIFLTIFLVRRPVPDKNTVETYIEENSISIPAEEADKFFNASE